MGRPGCGCCDDKCATTFKYDKETGKLLWKRNLGINTGAVCEHNGRVYVYVNESLPFTPPNAKRKFTNENVPIERVELLEGGAAGVKVTSKEAHLLEEEQYIVITGVTDVTVNHQFYVIEIIDETTFILSCINANTQLEQINTRAYEALVKPETFVRRFSSMTFLSNYDIVVMDLEGNIVVDECIQFMPPFENANWESNNTFNPNDNEATIFGYGDHLYLSFYGEEFFAGTMKIDIASKKLVGVFSSPLINKKNANRFYKGGTFYASAPTAFLEIDNLTYKITYQKTVNQLCQEYKIPYEVPFVNWVLELTYFNVETFDFETIRFHWQDNEEEWIGKGTVTESDGTITIKLDEKYAGITFLPKPTVEFGFIEYERDNGPFNPINVRMGAGEFVANVVKRPRFGDIGWETFYSGAVTAASDKYGIDFRKNDFNVDDTYNAIENKKIAAYNDVGRTEINLDNNTFKVNYLDAIDFGDIVNECNDYLKQQLRFNIYKEESEIVTDQITSGVVHTIDRGYNFPVFDAMYYVNNERRESDVGIVEFQQWVIDNGDRKVYYKPINYLPSTVNIDVNGRINGALTLNYGSYASYYSPSRSGGVRDNAFDASYDYSTVQKYIGHASLNPPSGETHVLISGSVVNEHIEISKILSPFGKNYVPIASYPPAANIVISYDAPNDTAEDLKIQKGNTGFSYYAEPTSFPAECNYFRKNNGQEYKMVSETYLQEMSTKSDGKGNLRYVVSNLGYPYNYYGNIYYNSYGRTFLGLNEAYSYYNLYNSTYNYYNNYDIWQISFNYFTTMDMSIVSNRFLPINYNPFFLSTYQFIQSDNLDFDFINDYKQAKFPDINNTIQDDKNIFVNGDTTTITWDVDGKDFFITDTSDSGFKRAYASNQAFRNSSTTKILSPNSMSILSYRYDEELTNPSGTLIYQKLEYPIKALFGTNDGGTIDGKTAQIDVSKATTKDIVEAVRAMSNLKVTGIGDDKLADKKYVAFVIEGDDAPIEFEDEYSFLQFAGRRTYISQNKTLTDGMPFTIDQDDFSTRVTLSDDIVIGMGMDLTNAAQLYIDDYRLSSTTNRSLYDFIPFESGIAPSGFPIGQIVFAYGMSGVAQATNPKGAILVNAEDNFITGPNKLPYYYAEPGAEINFSPGLAFYNNQQYMVGPPLIEKEQVSLGSGLISQIDRAADSVVDDFFGPSGLWDYVPAADLSGTPSVDKLVNFRYMMPYRVQLTDNFVPLFKNVNVVSLYNNENIKQFPYDNYGYKYLVNDLAPAVPHGREYLGMLFGLDLDTNTIIIRHVHKTDSGLEFSPGSVEVQGLKDIDDTKYHVHNVFLSIDQNANETQRFNVHRYGEKTWESAYLPQPPRFNYETKTFYPNFGRDYIPNEQKAMRDSFVTDKHLYVTGNKVRFTKSIITSDISYGKNLGTVISQDCFEDNVPKLKDTIEVMYSTTLGQIPEPEEEKDDEDT